MCIRDSSSNVEEALAFLEEFKDAKAFSLSPLRLAPSYLKMQQDLLATGELPVRCHVTVYHTMRFFLENPVKRWHDQPEQSGGMLTDIGIHAVELLNMFMHGQVRRIIGVSTKCQMCIRDRACGFRAPAPAPCAGPSGETAFPGACRQRRFRLHPAGPAPEDVYKRQVVSSGRPVIS